MSDAEIDRIFRSLDRIEARLLKLEEREAMRRGSYHRPLLIHYLRAVYRSNS